MTVEKAAKAVSTTQLLLGLLGLLKSVGLALMVLAIEWARRQKSVAEKETAIAKSDLEIEKGKQQIDQEVSGKPAADVIRTFLDTN